MSGYRKMDNFEYLLRSVRIKDIYHEFQFMTDIVSKFHMEVNHVTR
jgi:hypothetical protein